MAMGSTISGKDTIITSITKSNITAIDITIDKSITMVTELTTTIHQEDIVGQDINLN
jgi:hypothetical protein